MVPAGCDRWRESVRERESGDGGDGGGGIGGGRGAPSACAWVRFDCFLGNDLWWISEISLL